MGTLTVNSKHSDSQFSYVEGAYTLDGNAQTDISTSVMTSFNAQVNKTVDGVSQYAGYVSSNYDQSKGDEGLSYNLSNMGIDDIIAVAPIVKNCAQALAESETKAEDDTTAASDGESGTETN